ncbi:Os05g0361500 [Oryza sativa Japonica Group]|uniref:Pectinesterase n=1 Tax=Oryza sativa subsp. japonica TaxID=39947 RepID=Q0DIU9_ORYSJ|nr:Os05g0361500 [Oryza sativa Japonica Group]|eukprot:NP_001055310.1 Os05g0361500 [Oryza sativa Japonica Group]
MAVRYEKKAMCALLLSLIMVALSVAAAGDGDAPPSTPVSPTTACNDTTDPSFCRTVLPPRGSSDLYTYGRFSVARSLDSARRFAGLVGRYLARHRGLSPAAVGALRDCQLMSELNVDFLSAAGATLRSAADALPDPQADDVHTLLSAILTNQQTCLDGLQAASSSWSERGGGGLAAPIANGTKLYSLSLSLFTRAWVPTAKGSKHHGGGKKPHQGHGKKQPPAAAASMRRGLFDAADGEMARRVAMEGPEATVAVNGVVTVDQGGGGNYTTVGDAVAAAPSNLDGSTGHYVIYVAGGVYEENVVVPKHKRYIMMVGDGVGQTVITGNRSVVDGWTTFNSATFAVVGQGFVAMNMTFRNTAGPSKHQAVALRSGADLSAFYGCSFEAYQDTLYAHSLRQFYRRCDVYGTVDYVFGNAAVVFQSCAFLSRLPRPRPVQHRHGAGPIRPQPEHRHLHPGLLPPRRPGPRRRRRRRPDAHLPRPAVEELLQDGGHGVLRRRPRRPGRVDAVVRRLRARHALLRRVQQLRPRRRHQPPRRLAGLPRPRRRRRRRQLHRHQHGARRQLAAPDRRPLHQRLPHFRSTY